MSAAIMHWGLHAWAIYAVAGLSLAFFCFNRGMPLTLRSAFYPLIGKSVWGPFGHVVDIVAVLATLFGLAGLLWLFVLTAGPTLAILGAIAKAPVDYLYYLPVLSHWIGREDLAFLHDWTTFYWAWWIAWAPA